MNRVLAALAALAMAAMVAAPAQATTFPSLRLIYVAVGVVDNSIVGTTVFCTNQSGQTATISWAFFNSLDAKVAQHTAGIPDGLTESIGTAHDPLSWYHNVLEAASGFQGKAMVFSTQSGVFCSAVVASAIANDSGNTLHMIRFNAHPGSVE